MLTTQTFDETRLLKQPDLFQPFRVEGVGLPLHQARLPGHLQLLVFARGGERRALLVQEMAYHHLAQGELAGDPYIITFCGVCNSGMGMTPVVDGRVHHFEAGGLYNGVVILKDAETETYWDHITGQAVYGPLAGKQLHIWPVEMTTVKAALAREPMLPVLRSHQRPLIRQIMRGLHWLLSTFGFLPPFFLKTMAEVDDRLPKMTLGLGVVVNGQARFYPLDQIKGGLRDDWAGRPLTVGIDAASAVPEARWADGSRPIQLFLRWYGFSLTFPNSQVYGCR